MKHRLLAATAAMAVIFALGSFAQTPEKGGGGEFGPYELVPNWPQNPCNAGHSFGSTAGIFAETPDRVFIFQRG